MSQVVACPDCGTQNRAGADLCVQCWREMSAGAIDRIPAAAFAIASSAPGPSAPAPPVAPPRRVPAPRPASQPAPVVKPREAEPGAVPYFVPVGSASVSPAVGFPLPSTPSPTTSESPAGVFPWGRLVALGLVLALLGGGYFFFFGKSSGAFSPEDGSYSIELPEGWTPVDEMQAAQPQIDAAVTSESGESMIAVGHQAVPTGMTSDDLRAGVGFASQFMPRIPGLEMGAFRESTAVSGEGVFAYEVGFQAAAGLLPGAEGPMQARLVMAARDGGSAGVLLILACVEAECPTAEAAFQEMAQTFEFSR